MELDHIASLMKLKQTVLIHRVIETLGLDTFKTSGKFTPAKSKPLLKDTDGDPALGDLCYSSVVKIFVFLARYTRPDTTYAVSCIVVLGT